MLAKLEVALAKPYYVVGEAVSGCLYVDALEDLPLDKIYVKCKGKEKVKWEEEWDEPVYEGEGDDRHEVGREHHEDDYDEKDEFFKLKVVLAGEGTVLPAGKHAFPFSFNLPTHSKKGKPLTGSFKYKDGRAESSPFLFFSGSRHRVKNLKAKVEYSLKACVDIDDCKDMEKKVDMTVFQQPTHMIDRPMGAKVEDVMFCCCINKGEVSIRASCNKTYYTPGERGVAIMYLRNDSEVKIVPKVELNRFLYFKADGHHIYDHDYTTLGIGWQELTYIDPLAGDPAEDSSDEDFQQEPGESEVRIEFEIPNELPSTDGMHIDCAYRIDILAEIDWAPDIEIQFPLNIFMPPVEWAEVVPDAGDYVPYAESCIIEPIPFADGTVIDVVPEATVVVPAPSAEEAEAPPPTTTQP